MDLGFVHFPIYLYIVAERWLPQKSVHVLVPSILPDRKVNMPYVAKDVIKLRLLRGGVYPGRSVWALSLE